MGPGEAIAIPIVVALIIIGLPWLILHYITKWKQAATLSVPDEKLLDDVHDMARRLDDRLCSIERIMTADNPQWRQQCLPEQSVRLDDGDLDPVRRERIFSREDR
jgi:phage shock protein B